MEIAVEIDPARLRPADIPCSSGPLAGSPRRRVGGRPGRSTKHLRTCSNAARQGVGPSERQSQPAALITGITGQDGSYLAEFLLEKGYEVIGVVRRSSTESFERIAHLEGRIELLQADLLDQVSLQEALRTQSPARGLQPRRPELRADLLVAAGADRRVHRRRRDAHARGHPQRRSRRSASTRRRRREMFGKVREVPQNEDTPFYPRSPYGVAKAYGHFITVNYRESYDLFAVSGILFNHESPRRGLEFVTRKITDGVARIKLGLAQRAAPRQPRRPARLGLRRRLRARDVADAAAGRSRTTTSSRPARRTPSASAARSPSATSGSTGSSTS